MRAGIEVLWRSTALFSPSRSCILGTPSKNKSLQICTVGSGIPRERRQQLVEAEVLAPGSVSVQGVWWTTVKNKFPLPATFLDTLRIPLPRNVMTPAVMETTCSVRAFSNVSEKETVIDDAHIRCPDKIQALCIDKDVAATHEIKNSRSSALGQATSLDELESFLGFPLSDRPQVPDLKPLVIVISGPSGVGKDAVVKELRRVRQELHFVVTATTRSRRPGELHGVDYFFVSKEGFLDMIDKDELLEHAIVYGEYKGIPKQQVRDCLKKGKDVVLRVDVQGAATVRRILGSDAVFIFLVAESEVTLVNRLFQRKTETSEQLIVRVSTAREELSRLDEFDYVVENAHGRLETTVSLICSIIDAEKARVHAKTPKL